MEMSGDQELQLKTEWKSEFYKKLKQDEEKWKQEAKRRRAFLKVGKCGERKKKQNDNEVFWIS